MKKFIIPITATILMVCLFTSCRHHHHNHLSVSVSENNDGYKLQTDYNEDKTWQVQDYINEQIKPNRLFASSHDYFDANTELKDGTKFYVKASPGKLLIQINKQENPPASYARMKNICEGIAGILKQR